MEYSNKYRKQLLNRINNLSTTEHEEIFKIIKRNDLTYSQNKNGIFFNLSALPNNVIEELNKMVEFCISQKDELDEYDIKMNQCRLNNSVQRMDIKQHFEETERHKQCEAASVQEKLSEASMEKLTHFVEKIQQDRDKIGKKKTNTTFLNAKKKFLKRAGERKIEKDLVEDLELETI